MSQKSILSYFKSKDQNNVEKANSKTKSVKIINSSVKKEKRKALTIQSDDESEETENIPKKKPCTEVKKTSETSVSNEKKENTIKKNEEITEDNQDDQPAKKEVLENGKKEESPSTTKAEKKDSENVNSSEETRKISDQPTDISEKAGVSESDSVIFFTGKRKTARKQMNSQNKLKSNIPKVSMNGDVAKNVTLSPEAVDTENSDSKKELTTDVPKSPKQTVKETENGDSKKVGVKHKSKAADKVENSPVKKSKKETLHSFFAPVKVSENKNSTEEEKSESKETTVKEETSVKEETTVKVESTIKECDSPVKKIKKKKTQCLESDDESNDASSKETPVIKSEPEKSPTKNIEDEKCLQEKTDLNSQGEKEDKAKTDFKKESKGSESITQPSNKVLDGKQKLSVKSTSADTSVYDPSKSNYHPINDAFWNRNDKVPYLALSKTLELIEKTSGRLKIVEILSNFFRSVMVLSPDDMLQSVYLCLNRVAPEYEGIEMGVGDNLLMKAVAQATGRTVDKIKAEVAVKGDLGLVSESSRGNQRIMFPLPKLTVSAVFNKFREIAKMSGNAVMSKKTDMIKNLFIACRDCEAKYIIRSLSGKLRIGLAEQSVLSALARAAVVTPPHQSYPPEKINTSKGMSAESFKEFLDSQTLILKTAYCECPNYDIIIPVLLKEGISGLPEKCHLSPGVPLKPMLAHPTTGISNVLERFDKQAFTCEFKYDGERAQIHMNDKGEIKIFSRNQEDNTSKFPDIISRIKNALKESTRSFILDSEVVAWDREKKQILPFQVLSTRKRKDAVESDIVVQVCVMAFDLIYLNGDSLVKKPLKERRNLLHSFFTEVEDQFMFAKFKDGDTAEAMQEFLDESVKGNCEGLMVKALEVDASYEIAKRSHNWLKLKKDYLQGVGDTLDLVVIGGYYGKGKRTGNYGGFLLACYDPDETQEYQTICKLGTGFKEPELEAHTKFLKQHVIETPRSDYRYDPSAKSPDNWFDPVQVWEIKCADLSISPDYKAAIGIVDPSKGISLRFPRFVRIREDKTPELATNAVQIAGMYRKQQQVQNSSKGNSTNEEDYY